MKKMMTRSIRKDEDDKEDENGKEEHLYLFRSRFDIVI